MNVVRGSLLLFGFANASLIDGSASVRSVVSGRAWSMRLRTVCLMMSLTVLAGRASAQTINSPYRFIDQSQTAGLWGGTVTSASGTLDIGPQGGPVLGARYGIRLSGPF